MGCEGQQSKADLCIFVSLSSSMPGWGPPFLYTQGINSTCGGVNRVQDGGCLVVANELHPYHWSCRPFSEGNAQEKRFWSPAPGGIG
jgi:hypothetical protein